MLLLISKTAMVSLSWINPWKSWHIVDVAHLFVYYLPLPLECKLQGAYRNFSCFVHCYIPNIWSSTQRIVRTQIFVELMNGALWRLKIYNHLFLVSCKWNLGKQRQKILVFVNNITRQTEMHYYERKLLLYFFPINKVYWNYTGSNLKINPFAKDHRGEERVDNGRKKVVKCKCCEMRQLMFGKLVKMLIGMIQDILLVTI